MIKVLIISVLVVLVVMGIAAYNALVRARNAMRNAFVQIDVQLRRRYDLIPNLVETARAYMKHERETLEAVVLARNQAVAAEKKLASNPIDASAMRTVASAEALLGNTLGRLMALVESYPDLKANETMTSLCDELTSTENKVAFARQGFNDAVMFYNNHREQFPSNLIASWFQFRPAEPFAFANEAERVAPKVSF